MSQVTAPGLTLKKTSRIYKWRADNSEASQLLRRKIWKEWKRKRTVLQQLSRGTTRRTAHRKYIGDASKTSKYCVEVKKRKKRKPTDVQSTASKSLTRSKNSLLTVLLKFCWKVLQFAAVIISFHSLGAPLKRPNNWCNWRKPKFARLFWVLGTGTLRIQRKPYSLHLMTQRLWQ